MTVQNTELPPGMGQCSVTGAIVPEDDLVVINGQRVSAEGKAILLDRLKSGEAMPGEVEKPSVLRRFGGILLDVIILAVPFGIINAVLIGGKPNAFIELGIFTIISTTATIVYFGAMHAARGQTVGKMAAKMRVVNDSDGSPISAGTAYIRALVYSGPSYLTAFAYMTGTLTIITAASAIVGIWGLANVIVALVDSNRQRALHDRIAGTRVISLT